MTWKLATICLLALGLHYQSSHSLSKRNKWEIDDMKDRVRQLEISNAGQIKDINHLDKLSEDRREDIKKLFEKMEAK